MKGMTVTARSEKDEERDCDALVQSIGGKVRRYSQPRRTMQTAGIADREYVILDGCDVLRWEVKAEDGKLTAEQFDMLREDFNAGRTVGCGTLQDLIIVINSVRHSHVAGRELGWRLVELWAARGLRKTRKQRGAA
jgi:hypothetical protein